MKLERSYILRPNYLTAVEKQFFRFLLDHFSSDHVVLAKVAFSEIFSVAKPNENVKLVQKLQQKSIDFLLLDNEKMTPLLALELDDLKQIELGSSNRLVDEICITSGLEIMHILVSPYYDSERIRRRLAIVKGKPIESNPTKKFSPICPNCGITMVLRFDKEGPIHGNQYYGCLNYPECTLKLPV